jgi:phosphoribosylanthranilate isomerase
VALDASFRWHDIIDFIAYISSMARLQVKICGVKTKEAVEAAVKGGASFVGFNFFKPSPRYVTPEAASQLAQLVPTHRTQKVAVLVDPTDDDLKTIFTQFRPDLIQLHGQETPARVSEIKANYHQPIIKAFPITADKDFNAVYPYSALAHYFLFEGKPPAGSKLPGGNASPFDWKLLQGKRFSRPWFLAGGLNPKNIAEAAKISGAEYADVSSGVEKAPGEKDPALIKDILSIDL